MEMAAAPAAFLGSTKTRPEFRDVGAGFSSSAAPPDSDSARPRVLGAGKRDWLAELDQIAASRGGDHRVSFDGLGLLLVALGESPAALLLAFP